MRGPLQRRRQTRASAVPPANGLWNRRLSPDSTEDAPPLQDRLRIPMLLHRLHEPRSLLPATKVEGLLSYPERPPLRASPSSPARPPCPRLLDAQPLPARRVMSLRLPRRPPPAIIPGRLRRLPLPLHRPCHLPLGNPHSHSRRRIPSLCRSPCRWRSRNHSQRRRRHHGRRSRKKRRTRRRTAPSRQSLPTGKSDETSRSRARAPQLRPPYGLFLPACRTAQPQERAEAQAPRARAGRGARRGRVSKSAGTGTVRGTAAAAATATARSPRLAQRYSIPSSTATTVPLPDRLARYKPWSTRLKSDVPSSSRLSSAMPAETRTVAPPTGWA